ncbi:MAG: hypothetical protein DWC09_08245 [Candidatus Poseidoniales archaeon]|nr:MAG: hypothetical protein DWC09_08245 [Candidatus Poseidoniales archaeon]
MHVAFQPESKVTSLVLSLNGDIAAWAEGDGQVFIARHEHATFSVTGTWKAPSMVRGMVLRGNSLYVLDDANGLSCLDINGNVGWQFEIGAGGFKLQKTSTGLAIIDGLGRLFLVQYDGSEVTLENTHEDILHMQAVGDYLILAHENGSVQALVNGVLVWSRPARGEKGESITCIGSDSNNNLVIGREGYALVAGDEEVLEIEVWDLVHQKLQHRFDVKSRLLQAIPSENGLLCGFDDGKVVYCSTHSSQLVHETRLDCKYPIRNLAYRNGSVIATAWFYVFGREADGSEWKLEHQGMPNYLVLSNDGSICLFAGEDQNDWTEEEPIGHFSLLGPLIETDASELTLWFEKTTEAEPLSAEEIYRDDDAMNEFFTPDELASIQNTASLSDGVDALQAALGDVQGEITQVTADGALDIDTEQLLSELDDAITNMALLPEDGLLDELNTGISEVIVPKAITGDDQQHVADEDGNAIIILDGTYSHDPQKRIKTWSWVDSTGKEIASSSKVKVRLSRGIYRFELRVCDRDGQWSSDSLQVVIE